MARKRTDFIIIHCSSTKPNQNIDVDTIAEWHLARGFLGCGYAKVITRSGKIQEGRSIYDIQAANKDYNHKSVALCMVGGVSQKDVKVPESNFNEEQWISLEKLLDELTEEFPDAYIIGHNQISNKACPSFDVPQYLKTTKFAPKAVDKVCKTCQLPLTEECKKENCPNKNK